MVNNWVFTLIVIAFYITVQQIENLLIVPMLGKSRMVDYRLGFIPLSKAKESEQDSGPTPNTWVNDRKFDRQTVSL